MEVKINKKVCAVCGKTLITHRIPEDSIQKFLSSKECEYESENVVKLYLDSLSPKTRAGNVRSILRFCWIVGKTPRELCAMGFNKIGLKDVSPIEKMLDAVENYCVNSYGNPTLEFEKILPKSSSALIAKAVKGFFAQNKLDCSRKTLSKMMSLKADRLRNFIPTKKDIKEFRNYLNPRDKLLLELNCTLPLRREEIYESLTYRKLGELNKPYPIVIYYDRELKGHARLPRYQGCLFLGIIAESVRKKLIQRKEEERTRFTEQRAIWESKGYRFKSEFTEDTKIFLSSEVTVNEEEKTVSIAPLGYVAMGKLMIQAQRASGIALHLHLIRDYWQDMINAHCGEDANSVYANAFIAHKIKGTARIYSHPEQQYDKVLEVWKKLEPYVDLDFDESTITIKLMERAKQLDEEGKGIEEIMDTILKEQTQMMLSEVGKLKDSMIAEVKKAEEEHKRRTEK